MDSTEMKAFLEIMSDIYEIIILDSAPLVPVIDSQILARSVDTTILVVSAGKTEVELMSEAVNIIKRNGLSFLGVVLNNFRYRNGYHSYYKHYYHYAPNDNGKGKVEMKN